MALLCPECGAHYDRRERGSTILEPVDGRVCKAEVEFEGDRSTGVWYVHE